MGEVRGVGCIVLSQVLFRQFRWLQGQIALHVGVDNLNVVNHLSSLTAGRWSGRPFPLVNDGDLSGLAQEILHSRGRGTTLVSKVKGHADEGLVVLGRVRVTMRLMLLLTWGDGVSMTPLRMLGDCSFPRVHTGILLSRSFSISFLPLLEQLLAMTILGVPPCILLCGLLLLIKEAEGS